ncbi:MAG: type I-B CRISPR-associated protein Cas5 [Candidatus Aminicenantes bacterium]|nr:type I-B CRISPR-associated protein Cas5 [Candidatus Aminicenantes bacterium]
MNEKTLYVLRTKIYQPQAHYRIPFTYQRRHSYPIPPYSTVIGFLCNLLGYDGMPAEHKYLKNIKISVAGRFEIKTAEYVWFRNLSKDAHLKRFRAVENRSLGGRAEHIGGQSPVLIDILNEVTLIIYLAHNDKAFVDHIRHSLLTSDHRLEVLHLGRAEDWVVFQEISQVYKILDFNTMRIDANFGYFFWIPEKIYQPASKDELTAFEHFDGLVYRIPTFWTVENYNSTFNRHGRRIFKYMTTKLSDGLFRQKYFLFDTEINLPVFLADFGGEP